MKRLIYGIILFSVFQLSCSLGEQSRMTFKNMAQESVLVNFRGESISVSSGKTSEIRNIPKGTYTYATTYTIPLGTKSSVTTGALTGQVIINPGTKVLIVYSSTLIDSVYTIGATITTSDNLNTGTTTP